MPIPPGTYTLGPEHATLTVHTRRAGAAARAGHDLLIEVTAWSAELRISEDPAATVVKLTADSTSLQVREGTGGLQALTDEDRVAIRKTIDADVLRDGTIEFRSSSARPGRDEGELWVDGVLDLLGVHRPISFELRSTDDAVVAARATITQSDFGIKPYSTLFGALKVADEVRVALDGRLQSR